MVGFFNRFARRSLWRIYQWGNSSQLIGYDWTQEAWRKKEEENKAFKALLITSSGAHSSVKSMANVMDADIVIVDDDDEDRLTGKWLQNTIDNLEELSIESVCLL